jgi:2-methylcitrate dehydratase PrpD
MSTFITPQQMIEYMVSVLDNAVKDYPEEERETVKVKILDAFSAAMFKERKQDV